ncbi:DUF4328 domain-containing protein [Mucisphaera calidilacus]|uniref:DUF4328 domain-containing protein n=1 Tax=Mucisphaera calidilacus TaxID=2527982 RepID=A0A518BY69_9BACT|nr:DUF4328 domain-containing protein [Mucisphaera calidilacus]QDU71920.1 hypothetical protein Pan265_17790 [Mucisphaera calidilacus]
MSRAYVPEDYHPAGELGRWVVYLSWGYLGSMLLYLVTVALCAVAVGGVTENLLVPTLRVREDQALMLAMTAIGVVDWLGDVLLWISTIVFFVWLHRMVLNLRAMGVEGIEASPHGAWLWWLVPIANLFMPYLVLRQIGDGSRDEADDDGGLWTVRTVNRLWGVDITLLVISLVLPIVAGFIVGVIMVASPVIFEDPILFMVVSFVWMGVLMTLEVWSCLLCIRLVSRFTSWQATKAERVLDWY